MIKLRGDKDNFAGTYEIEGQRYVIEKWYAGKGVGARWWIKGLGFGERSIYNYRDTANQVSDWLEMGGRKTS